VVVASEQPVYPIGQGWNCKRIEDRLCEARLTGQVGRCSMLAVPMTAGRVECSGRPTEHLPEVDRVNEVLAWLGWLEPDLARLMWTRAQGTSWKAIAHCLGISVRTAQRQHRYALSIIVWRLHGRRIPGTWSRRFLLDRVAALSRGIS
jgi:hypothetical protein